MKQQIPYPGIHGSTQEQLGQIRAYLHRLAQQLNYILDQLERGKSGGEERL